MGSTYWEIEESAALTSAVRNALERRYRYASPAEHSHGVVVAVRENGVVLLEFVLSFRAQDWSRNVSGLEKFIAAECMTRLDEIKNDQPLTSLLRRRHPL